MVRFLLNALVLLALLSIACGGGSDGAGSQATTAPIPEDDRIRIPAISLDEPLTPSIVGVGGRLGDTPSPDHVLAYDFGALPGLGGVPGKGNLVVYGQVDSGSRACKNGTVPAPCEAVFYKLRNLKDGDKVQVFWKKEAFEYTVSAVCNVETAKFDDAVVRITDKPTITLLTTGGQFNQAAGAYSHFLVVRGSLDGASGAGCPQGAALGPPPSATAVPIPPDPGQEGDSMPFKGPLLFKAKLDGSLGEVSAGNASACGGSAIPAPEDAAVRLDPGAVVVTVAKPQVWIPVTFKVAGRASYVEEAEIAFDPASTFAPWMELRANGQANVHILFNTRQEYLVLDVWRGQASTSAELSPRINVAGLRSGRVIKIGVAVDRERYTVFLDGKKVIDVRSDEAGSGPGALGFNVLGCNGGTGVLRITGFRLYALAPGNDSR